MNNTSKEISNNEERFCPLCDKREYRNECSYGKPAWDKTSIKDEEYSMVRSELENVIKSAKKLKNIVGKGEGNLEAWVQSKITKAADYIDTAADYLESGEKIKEEISLVEKILGEEKCGKGMYWCNTDKVCKPLPEGMKVPGQKIKPTEVGTPSGVGVSGPKKSCNHTKKGKSCSVHGTDQCPMSEEKDPKGPVKSYKSPEELAKKHGVSVEEIKKQLEIGTKVELEHTASKSSARITALQHLGEKPDYYTKLKKMETQKESNTVRDANGNVYVEFIDIIKSGSIEEENPGLWANIHNRRKKGLPKKKPGQKGYPKTLDIEEGIEQARKNVGADKCWTGKKLGDPKTKIKGGKEVPNCVDEAVRLQAQTGNNIFVTLSWRGKYYTMQLFFPQSKIPSRLEISDEIQKIYPGSKVVTYRVADFKPGEPIVYAYKGGNAGKLGSNKNYVKPMGEEREIEPPRERVGALTNIDVPQSEREKARQRTLNKAAAKRKEREMKEEVEISESKKSEMPCNIPKAQAVGDSKTGKSHVVKACEGGKEKLIRFGQRGVKGSPKKEGESDEYASRRNRFKTRHAKNIAKGKMSAAYWANRVKW